MSCEKALQEPVQPAPFIEKFLNVAAAALIDCDNHILLTQRPAGKWMEGYWEFPGGKIEKGELPEYALMRELQEELGIDTRPTCFTPVSFVSHIYEEQNTHVFMPLYATRFWSGQPTAQEGQAMKWLKIPDIYQINLLPADIPLLSALERFI